MPFVEDLIARYGRRSLAVDTNILLLWTVGRFDRHSILRFKRTEQFTPADFDLLTALFDFFPKVVTTPNILTEVNSFAGQVGEPLRGSLLRDFAGRIQILEERYFQSAPVALMPEFATLGLTDCGLVQLAAAGHLVVTDDYRLANYLEYLELPAINFNHLRF